MTARWLLVPIVVLAIASSCAPRLPAAFSGAPHPTSAPPGPFRVGVARVDITPPPGVSTFGHGPDSLVADGYWTRIYCRVFVLSGTAGPLAVIPCDLPASSTLLQRAIAERLHGSIPATRIFLSATHTHAGPAHFFETGALNGALSTQMPGFDPKMVDFLADAIAEGVTYAASHLVGARLSSWHYERGEPCSGPGWCGTWGITWNRSLEAHERDGDVEANVPAGLCPVQQAIDPSLHVLRFDAIDAASPDAKRPLGMLVLYAMHPTVLPNTNQLIGADVDGLVSRMLERDMRIEWEALDPARRPDRDPLAGVVNTNEGDMSPVWFEGTKAEAESVASKLTERVRDLVKGAPRSTTSAVVDARYFEPTLPKAPTGRGAVCETAEVGLSVAYGACDHPTADTTGIPPSIPSIDQGCQSPKHIPGGFIENLLAGGRKSFQQQLPLGLVRIDDNLLAFVPAELTVDAGRAVTREILRRFGAPAHAMIGGLSNGYILYVTTPEEYDYVGRGGGCKLATDHVVRQSYEGGATVYGPSTLRFLVEQFGFLTGALEGQVPPGPAGDVDVAHPSSYRPSAVRARLPLPSGEATAPHAGTVCKLDARTVCFRWTDGDPGDVPLRSRPALDVHREYGRSELDVPWVYLAQSDGSEVHACRPGRSGCDAFEGIDDLGAHFVTRAGDPAPGGGSQWATLWRGTEEEWGEVARAGRVSLRVRSAGGVRSAEFGVSDLPRCSRDDQNACGKYDVGATQQPFPACEAFPGPGH